jgi:hypothetical protein
MVEQLSRIARKRAGQTARWIVAAKGRPGDVGPSQFPTYSRIPAR